MNIFTSEIKICVYGTDICLKLLRDTLEYKNCLMELRLIPEDPFLGSCIENIKDTHHGIGASILVDSPRRFLFRRGIPFVYLDADLLCVGNPVPSLLAIMDELSKNPELEIAACPAFRVKHCKYGTTEGGFNAGVMVCPKPNPKVAEEIEHEITNAIKMEILDSITEERILCKIFKGKWLALDPKWNLIKRVWKFAPQEWSSHVNDALFVHYMGAKPWMTDLEARKRMDWDSEGYETLESIWKNVYRDHYQTPENIMDQLRNLKPCLTD